jgi:hypothetical protein
MKSTNPWLIVLFLALIGSSPSVFSIDESGAGKSAGQHDRDDSEIEFASAESEEGGDDDKANNKEEERFRFLPIPIFITEPAIGEGLGLALTMFHPVKSGKSTEGQQLASLESIDDLQRSREAPPVVTGVAGAYTNSRTWAFGVGHFNNWRNDSIRYTGAFVAARVNSQIYLDNVALKFSMESAFVYQNLKFRLGESDFMLGGAISYLDADNTFGFGLPLESLGDRFGTDFKNIGLALKGSYETLDNTMNPHSGALAELSLWRYDDAIGGDYEYWSANIKALSFHSLSEQLTLGLRLEVSGVDGRVPFFAIPFVSLRGVPALRYQNKTAGAVEAEVRYLISPKWEVSVFGGLGFTSDYYAIFNNPDSIYNFGFGGRYEIFEAHKVWLGADIARGPEDWNWYIQVGHPW